MDLTDRQLATYLLEVREVAQLMLSRFAEIRHIAERLVDTKASEERQLTEWEARNGLDERAWRETMSNRIEAQAHYFSAVEAYLAGWARLSLLLFPVDGRAPAAEFRRQRGQRIRQALGVPDSSVLADRELRDSWMHFDERLDSAFIDNTFRERHRFVPASESGPLVDGSIALLEIDTLVVHYRTRAGGSASLNLDLLHEAVGGIREALRRTIAG